MRPPNYAATTSAILLWAKLYEVTKNATWLDAAERCAAAVGKNYLKEGSIQINGGELDDVMVNDGGTGHSLNVHGISGGTANCNINAKFSQFLLLKMQRQWRTAPEKRMLLY